MNMIQKIQMLMDKRDLKKVDVAKGSDLPYSTVDNLFKRGTDRTSHVTVGKLASFFDVSVEFLISDEENNPNIKKSTYMDITEEELNLLNLWHKLPRDEQMKLLGRIELKLEY